MRGPSAGSGGVRALVVGVEEEEGGRGSGRRAVGRGGQVPPRGLTASLASRFRGNGGAGAGERPVGGALRPRPLRRRVPEPRLVSPAASCLFPAFPAETARWSPSSLPRAAAIGQEYESLQPGPLSL